MRNILRVSKIIVFLLLAIFTIAGCGNNVKSDKKDKSATSRQSNGVIDDVLDPLGEQETDDNDKSFDNTEPFDSGDSFENIESDYGITTDYLGLPIAVESDFPQTGIWIMASVIDVMNFDVEKNSWVNYVEEIGYEDVVRRSTAYEYDKKNMTLSIVDEDDRSYAYDSFSIKDFGNGFIQLEELELGAIYAYGTSNRFSGSGKWVEFGWLNDLETEYPSYLTYYIDVEKGYMIPLWAEALYYGEVAEVEADDLVEFNYSDSFFQANYCEYSGIIGDTGTKVKPGDPYMTLKLHPFGETYIAEREITDPYLRTYKDWVLLFRVSPTEDENYIIDSLPYYP